jgi:HK97 family phage portal protein
MASNSLVQALAAGMPAVRKAAPVGTVPVRGAGVMGWVREPFAGGWQQGVTVDPLGSLTSFGAVYACISRIAGDIAKLEPVLLEQAEGGVPKRATSNSPFWTPLRRPNGFQNRIQWLSYWITCKLTFGNAYHLKVRETARGMVKGLVPLDPRRTTPMVTPDGSVYYSLAGDDLAGVPAGMVVPASEIIHDRCCTLWHPLVGISPLYACGLSATQGLRIQSNSATFFSNASRPSGMLTAPGTIDETTADRLKLHWEENYSGQNIGRLAVLGDGLKYEAMTIPAEASQMIEQLAWTVEDVARCFNVPLYKINSGPMPTNNNVEALEVQYYTGCLQLLIENIELCLREGLEVRDGMSVELDLEGLARMDSAAKIDMLGKAVGGALMKPDEARAKLRLDAVPGGDAVYLQQQNYSLAALARRDAQPDPFGAAPQPAPAQPAATQQPEDPEEPEDDDDDDAGEERTVNAIIAKLYQAPAALEATV